MQAPVDALPRLLVGAVATRSALQPRNGVSAAVRARSVEAGRSSASSSRSQSCAAAVANTLPAPLITAGTPAPSSASRTRSRVRCGADEHGDVARAQRLERLRVPVGARCLDRGVGGEQRDDVGGEVAGDVVPRADGAGMNPVGVR